MPDVAWASPSEPNASEGAASAGPSEIVVYGTRTRSPFEGLRADDELGREDIDAYGLDTVGQLLEQVSSEIQPGEDGPVVLVNGQRATGVNDINDLPVEAVSKIQILPRAAASRLGQSPSRRVINVVIKPDYRQITPSAQLARSTRGDAFRGDTELNLLKLANSNRRSLVLRASHIDPLFETERDISPDLGTVPFAPLGNIVAIPVAGGEIDPLLSAQAGRIVTVAAVPAGTDRPTLDSFAASAGVPGVAGANAFRSLVSDTNAYSANANVSQRLSDKTTLFLNAKVERNESLSLRGLSPVLLTLPVGSPFSPFGRDVGLATMLGDPLRTRQDFTNVDLAQTLNTRIGAFGISARANFVHRVMHVTSDRNYDFSGVQAGILSGAVNPFAPIAPATLGEVRSDRSRSRSDSTSFQLSANGPLFDLPAGAVQVAATGQARFDRTASTTEGVINTARNLRRDEIGAQGSLTLPLLRSTGPQRRSLVADLSGQVHKLDNSGALRDWGVTLNGELGRALTLSASYLEEEVAPPASALNDPVVVIENFRTYDFIRQETVLVASVSGGNPALPVQRRRTASVQANLRPFASRDVVASVEYLRTANRNVFAALPPVSAEAQAAFPDRFVRDAGGRLVQIDARPVTFLRDDSERLRWGIKLRHTFGGAAIGEDDADGPAATKGRGVQVNFDLTHDWMLNANRRARAALPTIDLLGGGAIGYGGGQVRHTVTVNAGVASRGVGLQLNGQFRGPSFLTTGTPAAPSRLTFADRTLINVRIFANLGPILRDQRWARGLRVSVQATSLFDSRQRVEDEAGTTPLRYQPFLIEPVGRTLTLGLRKVL